MAATATARANPPARVLVILLGSIGDVVRALPLLGRVRQTWPDAYLAWAIEPKSAPVLRAHPWVDELIVYDRARAPWSFLPFLRQIWRGRFDLVIDLQRHLKSGVIALGSRAPERWGFAPSNVKEFNHWFSTHQVPEQPRMRLKLEQYQVFGDMLGLAPSPVRFGLEPGADAAARVGDLLAGTPRPRLGVILGSSWPSRIYPADAVAAAIKGLVGAVEGKPGFFPVLLGGPDEIALADTVRRELGQLPMLDLAGKTRLDDLAAVFSQCDAAFGPDSGPMHIAAAVGCPIVSLWGATAAVRSAPWGWADFTLTAKIPCSPCYLRQCPVGGECMRRIHPDEVVAEVRRAAESLHPIDRSVSLPNGSAAESNIRYESR